jgi:hypothetical protein
MGKFKMKGFNPGKGTGMYNAGKAAALGAKSLAKYVVSQEGKHNVPGDLSKRKRVVKEKEIDPDTGGTITYKKKYRKSGELKKYKIRDSKGKPNKVSKFKKDKAGNIKEGEHHPSGLFKMNGKQDKKVPAIPTKEEGSDAWRANFLKRHKVTNDQVNNEIYKIGGGEDDVDFDDWKRVVLSLSKNKKAHQADWEPEFMGGDN